MAAGPPARAARPGRPAGAAPVDPDEGAVRLIHDKIHLTGHQLGASPAMPIPGHRGSTTPGTSTRQRSATVHTQPHSPRRRSCLLPHADMTQTSSPRMTAGQEEVPPLLVCWQGDVTVYR
jgi:hypothetical protein